MLPTPNLLVLTAVGKNPFSHYLNSLVCLSLPCLVYNRGNASRSLTYSSHLFWYCSELLTFGPWFMPRKNRDGLHFVIFAPLPTICKLFVPMENEKREYKTFWKRKVWCATSQNFPLPSIKAPESVFPSSRSTF